MAIPTRQQSTSDDDEGRKYMTPLINIKGLGTMMDVMCEPTERLQLVGHTSHQPWQPGIGSHNEAKSAGLKSPFLG